MNKLFRYIRNYLSGSHVLRTRCRRGMWADTDDKIEDALMLAIIDFVEIECFDSNASKDSEDKCVREYVSQSCMMRWLFPVSVPVDIRVKNAFAYMDFQIKSRATTKRDIDNHPYQKIKVAYLFAKNRYMTYDLYDESGLVEIYSGLCNVSVEKSKEIHEIANDIQAIFDKELDVHCANIVKYRKYLWT